MQRAYVLLPAASLAAPTQTILFHKQEDFREKVAESKMYVLISSTTFS
jgi:hypothetical protein